MLRCIFDCIATGSMILGVGGIAGVIEFDKPGTLCDRNRCRSWIRDAEQQVKRKEGTL